MEVEWTSGPRTNTSWTGRQSVYWIYWHRPLHQSVRYGMEHHFGYLLTSGLIAEACADTNQVSIAVRYSKTVWCIGLVLSSNRQRKDSPPTHVEREILLGRPCSPTHPCNVAKMALRTSCSTGAWNTTKVFSKGLWLRVHRITWILWCIWIGLRYCSVHHSHRRTQFYHPYCFGDSQNESDSDQAIKHSTVKIVWCTLGHQVATSLWQNTWCLSRIHLRLDWQHCSS